VGYVLGAAVLVVGVFEVARILKKPPETEPAADQAKQPEAEEQQPAE